MALRRSLAGRFRTTATLLVVSVESTDTIPPDSFPDLSKAGRYTRSRLMQFRKTLGMTEGEVDSLLKSSGAGHLVPSKAEGTDRSPEEVIPPTWRDIVREKEKRGEVYSPATILEAFPYLGGQPMGMPEFKDKLRREQMLAHLDAGSNHPQDVMMQFMINRIVHAIYLAIFFFMGKAAVTYYLDWHQYDDKPGFNPLEMTISDEEAFERV
eukprot:Sspe_Gene.19097::Locus_6928_Transcript_1_1_Confidence_1.000_Length_684::g.19097::m.19097